MSKHEEVIAFINKFTNNSKRQEVIECFTCGCCYWFAYILFKRFDSIKAWHLKLDIMYDEVANHFGCLIDDRIYDITGDVTEQYHWESCSEIAVRDELLWVRLIRDCIEMRNE